MCATKECIVAVADDGKDYVAKTTVWTEYIHESSVWRDYKLKTEVHPADACDYNEEL